MDQSTPNPPLENASFLLQSIASVKKPPPEISPFPFLSLSCLPWKPGRLKRGKRERSTNPLLLPRPPSIPTIKIVNSINNERCGDSHSRRRDEMRLRTSPSCPHHSFCSHGEFAAAASELQRPDRHACQRRPGPRPGLRCYLRHPPPLLQGRPRLPPRACRGRARQGLRDLR